MDVALLETWIYVSGIRLSALLHCRPLKRFALECELQYVRVLRVSQGIAPASMQVLQSGDAILQLISKLQSKLTTGRCLELAIQGNNK